MIKIKLSSLVILGVALSGLILFFDLSMPLGVAAGVPYVGLVLLGVWFQKPRHIIWLAIAASLLTIVGFVLSPSGSELWIVLLNRGLALLAIWVTALLLAHVKATYLDLSDNNVENEIALKALKDSELRFTQFAEASSDWLWEMGPDLRFSFLSERVEAVTGIPVSYHIGKSREDLAGEDYHTEKWEQLRAAIDQHKPIRDFCYSRMGPDGSEQFISVSGVPLFDEHGAFAGYRGSGTDISKQNQALKRAVQAEEKLKTAIESLEDGFVLYDADDRLVLCNEKYRDLYDLSKEMLVPGTPFSDIIRYGAERGQYPAAVGRVDEWVEERLRLHRAADTEVEQKLPDGTWLKISERPTPDGGIVGFRVNVTHLKSMQEKAEAASLAKSNFLSTMSHEIRTPLNGVMGLAQLLTDTKLDPNQRRKVDTIIASGQTLLAIINDVLDMSKIEAGGIQLEHQSFSLNNLISTISTPFQSVADDRGLRLIVNDQLAGNLTIKGDQVRLRQILWNLLSNAIKFTDQGSVTLSIKELSQAGDRVTVEKAHVLEFSVEDTGAGIAVDRIDAIFEAFTQEDNSITRKHGGTGLGLSIVRQLTELMGGTVHIESQLGKGTAFYVFLPFDAATTLEENAISQLDDLANSPKSLPLKVLMAEDNTVNALITQAFLEKSGHSVRHAENGDLAVKAAKENWADLILMDIHMPEMNGIDATKAIRQTPNGQWIPIIGLTAEAFAERHVTFIEAGMNAVLTKPFSEHQLAKIIADHRIEKTESIPSAKTTNLNIAPNDTLPETATPLPMADTANPRTSVSSFPSILAGDEAKLEKFRTQLDAATFTALLIESQKSLKVRLTELQRGASEEDALLIKETAHSIKGAAGSMFASHVAELAAAIESCSDDIMNVRQLMPEIELAAEEASNWWQKHAQ